MKVPRRIGLSPDSSDRFIREYSGILGLIGLSNAKRKLCPPIKSLSSSFSTRSRSRAGELAHWKTISKAE